jgi:WD40 repeat protein
MRRVAFVTVCAVLVTSTAATNASAASAVHRLWVARYDDPRHKDDAGAAAAVSPDGSTLFVTGYGQGAGTTNDFVTIAYDPATGAQRWVARYDGPFHSADAARFISVSPDGSKVFVAGTSISAPHDYDWATVAYDASTGAELWAARYGGPGHFRDDVQGLGVSPDGSRVFETGSSTGVGTKYDIATVAYDASSGAQEWAARYNRLGNSKDVAVGLAVAANGSAVFVTGTSYVEGRGIAVTISYAASTGGQRWMSTVGGGAKVAGSTAIVATGSRVVVFGVRLQQPHVTAYDPATGSAIWTRRYANHGTGIGGFVAAASPDGSTIFLSSAWGQPATMTTVALAASNGARLWKSSSPFQGHGAGAAAIAVSPDGSMVFVAGASIDGGSFLDYATVAIDAATGRRLWSRLYRGPGNSEDIAYGVASSPDGSRAFVTGRLGGTPSTDIATVAYAN